MRTIRLPDDQMEALAALLDIVIDLAEPVVTTDGAEPPTGLPPALHALSANSDRMDLLRAAQTALGGGQPGLSFADAALIGQAVGKFEIDGDLEWFLRQVAAVFGYAT